MCLWLCCVECLEVTTVTIYIYILYIYRERDTHTQKAYINLSIWNMHAHSHTKMVCHFPPSLLHSRGLPLFLSACFRVRTGVSVMTMSQHSSLPITQAVITLTHMELSLKQLLHIGTQPPSTESERDSGKMKRGREWEFPTASTKRPLAVTISSMRRVLFNYSNCAAIPQFTGKCYEATAEQSYNNLFLFLNNFPIYWVCTFFCRMLQTMVQRYVV